MWSASPIDRPKVRGHSRPPFSNTSGRTIQINDNRHVVWFLKWRPTWSGTWPLFCSLIVHTCTSLVTSTGGVLYSLQSKALLALCHLFFENDNFRSKSHRSSSDGHRRSQRRLIGRRISNGSGHLSTIQMRFSRLQI